MDQVGVSLVEESSEYWHKIQNTAKPQNSVAFFHETSSSAVLHPSDLPVVSPKVHVILFLYFYT